MATLKIIDGRDKFVFEVDGHKIPTVGAAEEEGYIFDNNT